MSDNVKCYSGNGLLGAIIALSITSGIQIERLVHGEAGEGKSELNAHFACAFAWLKGTSTLVTTSLSPPMSSKACGHLVESRILLLIY